MTALQEIIASADALSQNLEKAAKDEKKFCDEVCLELERYSWDLYKLANDIREMKNFYGG